MVDVNGNGGFGTKANDGHGPTLPQLLENMPGAHVIGVEHDESGEGINVWIQQGENGGQAWIEQMTTLERRAPDCERVSGLLTAAQNMRVQPYGYVKQISQDVDEAGDALAALLDEDGRFYKLDAPGVP